jgi:hypothetical protein
MAQIFAGIYGVASVFMGNNVLELPSPVNATLVPAPLLLKEAPLLLANRWLPLEAGYALNSEGMYHVAANTMMKGCSS